MIESSFWLTTLVVSITILLGAGAVAGIPYRAAVFAAAMLLSIAPASSVFSGFASSAFWLVLSGFVLGAAIRKVGLAQRWANWLVVPFSQSWPRMVAGTVLLSYLLALVMPSNMGRIALLMPVVLALGERAGIRPGSRGSIGLALAVGFGTFQLSASILPANVPNGAERRGGKRVPAAFAMAAVVAAACRWWGWAKVFCWLPALRCCSALSRSRWQRGKHCRRSAGANGG